MAPFLWPRGILLALAEFIYTDMLYVAYKKQSYC